MENLDLVFHDAFKILFSKLNEEQIEVLRPHLHIFKTFLELNLMTTIPESETISTNTLNDICEILTIPCVAPMDIKFNKKLLIKIFCVLKHLNDKIEFIKNELEFQCTLPMEFSKKLSGILSNYGSKITPTKIFFHF